MHELISITEWRKISNMGRVSRSEKYEFLNLILKEKPEPHRRIDRRRGQHALKTFKIGLASGQPN